MLVATAPETLTIAHLDETFDYEPLDSLIEKALPGGCFGIEFIDDNRKRGYRALEYKVEVIAGHTYDEDGISPKTEYYPVSIEVSESMSLSTVVFLLIGEIQAYIES
ncbi:hypothetical protein [Spirosoma litoris]